jgi:hypothetical protein
MVIGVPTGISRASATMSALRRRMQPCDTRPGMSRGWSDLARVATAHRDHGVGGLNDLVGHRLGELLADVDPELRHRRDDMWVDAIGRVTAGGALWL